MYHELLNCIFPFSLQKNSLPIGIKVQHAGRRTLPFTMHPLFVCSEEEDNNDEKEEHQ